MPLSDEGIFRSGDIPTRMYSIDPGLDGTGWAEWFYRNAPERVGILHSRPSDKTDALWWHRVDHMCKQMAQVIREGGGKDQTVKVYCEMPQFMAGAQREMGWRQGSLQKLTYLVGAFSQRLRPCRFYPVLVNIWKGQMSKEIVIQRITRDIGRDQCQRLNIHTHAWDATGLGLWALGRWI